MAPPSVHADLLDSGKLRPLMDRHDAVVNLATHMPASSTRMLLPGAWRENDRLRRDGSAALVVAALAAGVPRFIQESFAPMGARDLMPPVSLVRC